MTQFVVMNVRGTNYNLIPLNHQTYDGFVTLGGHDYRLRIKVKAATDLTGAVLQGDWKLSFLLADFNLKNIIAQRLQQSLDLKAFMDELLDLLTKHFQEKGIGDEKPVNTLRICTQLLEEIQCLGWNRVSYVDQDFTQIHMSATDFNQRNHLLKIELPKEFPSKSPIVHADMPFPIQTNCTKNKWILGVYEEFQRLILHCQGLWNILDEIDSETWVLEPEKPFRKDVYRRIALGSGASLLVTLDPNNPQEIPTCRFLGSDRMIKPLEDKFLSGLQDWNMAQSLLQNLKSILEIDFPKATEEQREEFREECGICYMYRFNDNAPDKMCDDVRCSRPFHTICLYEWLKELPSSRQSFDVLFGNCPYCEKPITCKILLK